jgi:hypothetical protein
MATTPTAMPDQQAQGAAPPAGGGAPPQAPPPADAQQQQQPQAPSQAPGTDLQRLLAQWYQVVKQMAASDPRLAAGAEKVSQGIQDIPPPQPTPMAQQPQY